MAKNEDEIQGLPIFLQDGLKQIKLLSDDLDFRQKRKVFADKKPPLRTHRGMKKDTS